MTDDQLGKLWNVARYQDWASFVKTAREIDTSNKQEAVYPTLKGHQAMWDEWHAAESGKQEAIYQQKVMGAWVDCNKQIYDAWPNEKRIVYAHLIASADDVRDAKRYRWLREQDSHDEYFVASGSNGTWGECGHYGVSGEQLDDVIDAALAANRASEEPCSHDYKRSDGVCIECGELSASTDTKEK
jgi:hypothetical protein